MNKYILESDFEDDPEEFNNIAKDLVYPDESEIGPLAEKVE